MIRSTRFLLAPLLSSVLVAAAATVPVAAAPSSAAHHRAPRAAPVTIAITTTGATVWGKVTVTYTHAHRTTRRSCSAATCTLQVPRGATLHLSQAATDSATWPFKDWQVSAHGHVATMTGSSIALKVTDRVSVTAVYVVAQSQSSSGGDGGYWP